MQRENPELEAPGVGGAGSQSLTHSDQPAPVYTDSPVLQGLGLCQVTCESTEGQGLGSKSSLKSQQA